MRKAKNHQSENKKDFLEIEGPFCGLKIEYSFTIILISV